MWGQIAAAVAGGAASSLFAPKPQYVVPNYKGIRNAAEKAGFNPLTALTQGPQGSVVQGQNYMGAAISDALLIAAGDKEKDARISLLEAQTENYKKSVENMTLRPKIGGVYEKRNADAVASASGASNDRLNNQGDGVSVPDQGADPAGSTKSVVKNTFETFSNNGQTTQVPIGPDIDEVISGFVISEVNKSKEAWMKNNMNMQKYPPSLNYDNFSLPSSYKEWAPAYNTALGRQRPSSGIMNPLWDDDLLPIEKIPFWPKKTDLPRFQLGPSPR